MIRHALHMVGATAPADILAAWNARREHDAIVLDRAIPEQVVAHEEEGELVAYVNHGRWVADCPDCNAGIAVALDGQPCVCCTCGAVRAVALPADRTRRMAEKELLERTHERHRNWDPTAETVGRLRAERLLLEGVVDG